MMRTPHLPLRLARTSSSIIALATMVVGAGPATAQSFLGTGTATNGSATTIATSPGTTTISVTAPQTVINWVPTDNATNNGVPIAFQNAGTSANFLGSGNYAVLNNITATDLSRVISMNGTITAGALESAPSANGSIYFYSPSGILLGGNSTINVGSLVMSASPIFVDGSGNFVNGTTRQVVFGQAPRTNAAIATSAGSQINATGSNSYVAMVAPRVQHDGAINVNGSAALVGAEAAVINFSPDGLFDIQVTTGTSEALKHGVVSGGTITGPAGDGNSGDHHRAYLVAVPKNDALTMAITQGANLGFAIAGAADVDGNAIVLSAGYNITGGAIESAPAAAGGAFAANLSVAGATMTSALVAAASGSAEILSPTSQPNAFASNVQLFARGNITADAINTGGFIDISSSAGSLALTNLDAGAHVNLMTPGSIVTGDVATGDFVQAVGGSITTGDIQAGQRITLASPGTITTGDIEAGGIFMALGHGDMSFGNATASEVFLADYAMFIAASGGGGGSGGSEICVGTCGTLGANGVVVAPPSGSTYSYVTTEGGVSGAGQIPGEGGTNGSVFTSTPFAAAAGDDLNFYFNYVTSDGSGFADYAWAALFTTALTPVAILFTARTQPTGTIVPGQNLPGVEATLNPSTVPIIPGGPAWNPLGDSSGDCFAAGCGFTGWINSTYDIADAGNYVVRFGVTNWQDTLYQSGLAFSGITIGGIPVQPGITRSGGAISIGNVDTGKFTAAAGTTFTGGLIDSSSSIQIEAGGNISAGDLIAGTTIDVLSGGSQTLAALTAGGAVELDAEGGITFGAANAGSVDFTSGGAVTGGNINALSYATGEAEGAIVLGTVTTTGAEPTGDLSVGLASATAITVGNVSATGRFAVGTSGDLIAGTIGAGSLVMALVGGDIDTGAITTASNGRVYLADSSMVETGGGIGDFNPSVVLGLDPVATGGRITIGGAVVTGQFQAAAGDNLATRAITATSIDASAGGTAAIDGVWQAPDVTLSSGDVNITTNGGIDAGSTGEITLQAVNDSGPALIGDGLTGTGYALSNAEFGRISGGDITIAVGWSGGDADTLIGDLTISASAAGSNIESSDGGVSFVTLDEAGNEPDGTLRVLGDVLASGFGAENYLSFSTQNFELDAATGTIAITGSGTTLAGLLELYASRIHVAQGSLLDQLAANPQFTGYRAALNGPATVQRPDGVIRAASFEIEFGGADGTGPNTLYVQNTGTTAVPAGFVVNAASIGEDGGEGSGDLMPGSVDLAINGQIVTPSGTSTGVAVRDLLVAEFGITAFVAGSTINGCTLVGSCGINPVFNIPRSTDIPLSGSDGFGDGAFGNEGDIAEGEGGSDGRSSPIAPPNPLFDSRPLVRSSDIDDPVSGAGNPSLYGSPDDDIGACDNSKDAACKLDKKGDGK